MIFVGPIIIIDAALPRIVQDHAQLCNYSGRTSRFNCFVRQRAAVVQLDPVII